MARKTGSGESLTGKLSDSKDVNPAVQLELLLLNIYTLVYVFDAFHENNIKLYLL
jgi:hypothetical protein